MTIYGVSQTSGVERRVMIEQGADGIVLIFTDHVGNRERSRIMVQPDDLLAAITDPPAGGTTINGIAPPNGPKMHLDLEVRRNEVLLQTRTDAGVGADAAVGLDDFQDGLEGVLNRS